MYKMRGSRLEQKRGRSLNTTNSWLCFFFFPLPPPCYSHRDTQPVFIKMWHTDHRSVAEKSTACYPGGDPAKHLNSCLLVRIMAGWELQTGDTMRTELFLVRFQGPMSFQNSFDAPRQRFFQNSADGKVHYVGVSDLIRVDRV